MNIKHSQKQFMPQEQRGSVMLICIVLLTILSLIGIGSANNAVLEEKMSVNSQLKATAFQMTKSEGAAQIDSLIDDITPIEQILEQQTIALAKEINQPDGNIDSDLIFVRDGVYIARKASQISSANRSQARYTEITTTAELGATGTISQQTRGIIYRLPSVD